MPKEDKKHTQKKINFKEKFIQLRKSKWLKLNYITYDSIVYD